MFDEATPTSHGGVAGNTWLDEPDRPLSGHRSQVLLATAEFSPIAQVGGLATATAGLTKALTTAGTSVRVVMPDYGSEVSGELSAEFSLHVPEWVGPTSCRIVRNDDGTEVCLVRQERLFRPHPYNDPSGHGWSDNIERFVGFSRAVAALADVWQPDVVHLNDWHTAAAASWLSPHQASLLTIHNLEFQGWCEASWLTRLGPRRSGFIRGSCVNLLAGAIATCDRVVAVSRTYADETRTPEGGAGLHDLLATIGSAYTQIRNGIDRTVWDPSTDPALVTHFDSDRLDGKRVARDALLDQIGWEPADGPLIAFVGRFVEQKGIDLLLSLAPFLHTLPARLVLMGKGTAELEGIARRVEGLHPAHVHYAPTTEATFARRLMAAADLVAVPSRFEPCGLIQMEAMTYGALPVVSPVGGLNDTVVDITLDPERGTGIVGRCADSVGLLDALHRAVRVWSDEDLRRTMQARAMRADWSWAAPALEYESLYEALHRERAIAAQPGERDPFAPGAAGARLQLREDGASAPLA